MIFLQMGVVHICFVGGGGWCKNGTGSTVGALFVFMNRSPCEGLAAKTSCLSHTL